MPSHNSAPVAKGPPALLAHLSEVVAVAFYFEAIGVIYSICFFAGFGLNFADYAKLDDLILGSFKEPVVFAAALGVVLWLVFKKATGGEPIKGIVLLTIPVVLAAAMAICAYYYITLTGRPVPFSNTGMQVKVLLAESLAYSDKDRQLASVQLIGTSGDYFFFFDTLTENGVPARSTIVLPKSSVLMVAAVSFDWKARPKKSD